MKIDRETLLGELTSVAPGLAKTETTEQSDCFVFKDDRVYTFNEEIGCSVLTCLKGITGAVRANSFLNLLQKLKESNLEITREKGELRIKGTKGRRAGVKLEKEILLPIDRKLPSKWKNLPKDFTDAVKHVQGCAGHDTTNKPILTFIHITPKYVEASDDHQAARWSTSIDLRKDDKTKPDILVRGSIIKQIVEFGMDQFSDGRTWVHFRNKDGVVMSCRRFVDKYVPMDDVLAVEGKKVALPKGLAEAIDKANIFSMESSEGNKVRVMIHGNRLALKSIGSSGWYLEPKKLQYDGPDLSFLVKPDMLKYVATEHNECILSAKRLKVHSGKFEYIAVLWVAEDKKKEPKKKKEKK